MSARAVVWAVLLSSLPGLACDPRGRDDAADTLPARADVTHVTPESSVDAAEAADPGPDVITNSVGMKLRRIPPGTFKMGSAHGEEDEESIREVTISRAFHIGVYEVTQEEWEAVMGTTPSEFWGPRRPVDSVSWKDVQKFLKKLSRREGVTYRLPTEAEWEYACRAGTTSKYYWGDAWDDRFGWCNQSPKLETQEVGVKLPNAWGLYDMSGNVYEWCQDWYDSYPGEASARDPAGPDDGWSRVMRGGSWFRNAQRCRSANRSNRVPDFRGNDRGFRVVREP